MLIVSLIVRKPNLSTGTSYWRASTPFLPQNTGLAQNNEHVRCAAQHRRSRSHSGLSMSVRSRRLLLLRASALVVVSASHLGLGVFFLGSGPCTATVSRQLPHAGKQRRTRGSFKPHGRSASIGAARGAVGVDCNYSLGYAEPPQILALGD